MINLPPVMLDISLATSKALVKHVAYKCFVLEYILSNDSNKLSIKSLDS